MFSSTRKRLINKGYKICDIKQVIKYSNYYDLYNFLCDKDMNFSKNELDELVNSVLDYDKEKAMKIELILSIQPVDNTVDAFDCGYDYDDYYSNESDYYDYNHIDE